MNDWLTVTIVPPWLARTMRLHGLHPRTIFDYHKLRSILSVEDLAGFIRLQTFENLGYMTHFSNGFYLLDKWRQSHSESEKAELVSVVTPLSYSEKAVDYLKEQYACEKTDVHESVEIFNDEWESISIVAHAPLLDDIHNERGLDAVRAVLQPIYRYYDSSVVAKLSIFPTYVRLLQKSKLSI